MTVEIRSELFAESSFDPFAPKSHTPGVQFRAILFHYPLLVDPDPSQVVEAPERVEHEGLDRDRRGLDFLSTGDVLSLGWERLEHYVDGTDEYLQPSAAPLLD